MKVKLMVECGNLTTRLTVGNTVYAATLILSDISQVPPPANPNKVDTGDGDITAADVTAGKVGYAAGQRVVGTFEQNNPNIIDTGDGDIAAADVAIGKAGYACGEKITGTLDVAALVADAYDTGVTDTLDGQNDADITPADVRVGKIAYRANNARVVGTLNPDIWQPDPLWWDIKAIIDADTENYSGKLILLADDEWHYTQLRSADAYRTSDGAFYTPASRSEIIEHYWQPSAYKTDSRGYKTKYIIMYWNTPTQPILAGSNLSFYPVYAVGKGLVIPFQNFLCGTYALQAYDHINCRYTGANASQFLGSTAGTANNNDFQHFPDDIDFSGVTNFSYAIDSVLLKYANLSTLDWKKLGANPTTVMQKCVNIGTLIGTVDLSNFTGASFQNVWLRIRKINITGVKRSVRLFSQSTMPHDTMLDIVRNFPDNSGNAPITIAMSAYAKTLTPAEIEEHCTSKNIILA